MKKSMLMKKNEILERLKQNKLMAIVLAAGIIAMLALMLSEFIPKGGEREDEKEATAVTAENTDYNYAENVEKRLTEIISSIVGAGETKVMVTLESGSEQIYAENKKTNSKFFGKGENADRSSDETLDEQREYIIIETAGGDENGLILKVIQPKIRGVAVVCEGGDAASVREQVLNTVTAVLGISAARVNIAKMK